MILLEIIGRDGLRPHTETVDAMDRARLRHVNDHRCDTAEIHLIGLQHADGNARSNTGVDRIAAGLENFKARVRGKVMPGRDDVARAHDGRAVGRGVTECCRICCLHKSPVDVRRFVAKGSL